MGLIKCTPAEVWIWLIPRHSCAGSLTLSVAVLAKMEGNDRVAEGTGFLSEGCSVVKPGLFLPPSLSAAPVHMLQPSAIECEALDLHRQLTVPVPGAQAYHPSCLRN